MKKFKLKSTISIHKAGKDSLTVKVNDSDSQSEKVIGLKCPEKELVNYAGVDYFDDNTLARLLYEAHNKSLGLNNIESGKLQEILRNVEFVECVE